MKMKAILAIAVLCVGWYVLQGGTGALAGLNLGGLSNAASMVTERMQIGPAQEMYQSRAVVVQSEPFNWGALAPIGIMFGVLILVSSLTNKRR